MKVRRVKKQEKLSHAQSQDSKKFFVNNARIGVNENMSLPDAVARLYIMNVEAAQNQVNLQDQIQTTTLLNKNFDRNFKRNRYNKIAGKEIV